MKKVLIFVVLAVILIVASIKGYNYYKSYSDYKTTINNADENLTEEQAKAILDKLGTINGVSYDFKLNQDNNYVNKDNYPNDYKQILSDYYIFNLVDKKFGDLADSNYCVNKKTGEVYVANPGGEFKKLQQ